MDKLLQQQQVLERLAEDLLQAEEAARAAHEAATQEEKIAENKYDTLGLEAAALATGQARRAEAIRQLFMQARAENSRQFPIFVPALHLYSSSYPPVPQLNPLMPAFLLCSARTPTYSCLNLCICWNAQAACSVAMTRS